MKKNILVGQSGGPTAAINSSLYGVIAESLQAGAQIDTVYGMSNGISGFLKDQVITLSDLTEDKLSLLPTTPGAYLGSCRYKLPEDLTDPVYETLWEKFEKWQIGYVLYIGGNDSMDTVSKLSRYAAAIDSDIRFIGVPKTIDNDLINTDHTPGFGSAAKFVASMVRQMVMDCEVYQTKAVTIIEVMGRAAGWLTGASALARKYDGDNPVLIYLPEVDFSPEKMIADIEELLKQKNALVICVSEGIHDADGKLICEYGGDSGLDVFGHKNLTGCGKVLEEMIRTKLGIKVRSVELNITQRCCATEASLADIQEAENCGREGVKLALSGATGLMVSMKREEGREYQISYPGTDVHAVCNQERLVPLEWINPAGNDITEAFIKYAKPLIQGESRPPMEDGLPKFLFR